MKIFIPEGNGSVKNRENSVVLQINIVSQTTIQKQKF